MVRFVRSCIHAVFSRRPEALWGRSLLTILASAGLSVCIVVATAAGSCSITTWSDTESLGGTNPAHEDIRSCYVADPINCATGNLTETQVDLAVQGHGPELQATRYYNSQVAVYQSSAGPFGFGWSGSYSAKLSVSGAFATITHDNGSTINFEFEEGAWQAPSWTQATLVKLGENYVYTQPDHVKLEFNSGGRLLKITDRHNLSLTMTYNGSGRLEKVTDSSSRKTTYTYNTSGQVEKITDPMGRVVKYGYTSGNLTSVTLPGSETPRWQFGYNSFHEMTSITDGRGHTTTTTYDALHRATTQTDALSRKYTFEYKETKGIDETTVTEPNGATTLKKFNAAGSPISITQAIGMPQEATSTFTYNGAYQITTESDPLKNTTSYTYDAQGNRLSVKDANGNETKWTYNSSNYVTSMTNPKGQVTTFTLNSTGDPTVIKRSLGASVQEAKFEYSSEGDLMRKVDPVGRERKYFYNPSAGNVLWFEYTGTGESQAILRAWQHNADGEIVAEIDGRGYETGNEPTPFTTKITRDSQGRPTVTTDPLGNTTKVSYDANGNIETLTDSNGHATSYVYDNADQRVEVKFASGATVNTSYDLSGQVKTRTNGNGNVTEYKRDLLGRVTEAVDPLGRKTSYEYDAAGNVVKETDAEGRTKVYSYDPGNRRTKIDFSEASTADISFVYDKNGNVSEMTDGTGVTKRVYDALDRPVEVTNGKSEVVKYEYNLADDVTKLTYPNGKAITRGFDSFGRLSKVVDWFGKETQFTYYRNSQLKSTVFPAETGNVDEVSYNARGDVTQMTIMKGLEGLASFSYSRDKNGQLEKTIQKGFPGRPEELLYGYDADNRLLKSNGTVYEYDATNLPTKFGPDLLAYDKASQISTAGSATVTYNKLGQRTKSTPSGGQATSYSYDQAGNLISAQKPAEGENPEINNTFKYDGTGLRTTETNGASTYPMVWDSTGELPLLLRKGNDYYIYGPEGLPVEQIISSSSHFLHHDQQGSTRVLTDSTGSVIGTYEYSPYGAIWNRTGSQTTQMGFGGQYRSHGSALIYLRARTYDPATGQFLSVDPVVAETGDPYGYAESNPLNRSDPTGLTVYGVCGSLSISLIVAGASGTGCLTVDGSGNVGLLGYGKGLKLWGSPQEWGEGFTSYFKGIKELIKIDSTVGAWKTLGKSFGRFFDGELGLLWSNADSIEDLNGKFDSVTDNLTVGYWHANSMSFENDKGVYGYINTAGPNSMFWVQKTRGPCEEIDIFGRSTGFDLF
jgi:RHS repeat-associated protein